MSDKKHIDRLFQEKLKDFEMTPNDSVWKSIENELHQKKRRRRVVPLWWQVAGVAAVLALLFMVGNSVFNNSSEFQPTPPTVVETNDGETPSDKSPDENIMSDKIQDGGVAADNTDKGGLDPDPSANGILNNTKNIKGSITNANSNSNNGKNVQNMDIITDNALVNPETGTATASNTKNDGLKSTNLPEPDLNNTKNQQGLLEKETLANPVEEKVRTGVANNDPYDEISGSKVEDSKKVESSIEDAIADTNNTDEKEKDEKLSRWNISTNVAPVYFSSLGKGSSLDAQFVENSKSGEINMSYGVNASYAINKKLKIRAGINKVDLGYNTNNVIVNRSEGFSSIGSLSRSNSNIRLNEDSQNTTILSSQNLSIAAVPNIVETSTQSSINQELGFIELPVEFEYALLDNKLGVNVIGGFSTFFLDKNKVYSTFNGEKALLGEANNINNTSYSANFGLGLDYNVSDKIILNLEPTFKYQINTFRNTSGDFRPYFIGIYTGLRYKF